jgi:hypothetical protein
MRIAAARAQPHFGLSPEALFCDWQCGQSLNGTSLSEQEQLMSRFVCGVYTVVVVATLLASTVV